MMNIQLSKLALVVAVTMTLDACVSYPQPIGYRMTSDTLPVYVNGQYIGMQPNIYGTQMPTNQTPVTGAVNYATTTVIPIYDTYYTDYYGSPFYNVGFGYGGSLGWGFDGPWGSGWYGGYTWYPGYGGYRGYYGNSGYHGWHGGNGGNGGAGNIIERRVERGGFISHSRGHR